MCILRRATCAIVVLAGCGLDVGPPAEWIATDSIDGALAVETGAPPVRPLAPVPSGSRFRIVTFNVDLGGDPARLASEILGNPAIMAADLYLLQEEESYPSEGATRASRLAALLDTGWIYVPGRVKGDGTHGLAILSRYPIGNAAVMELPHTADWKPRIAIRAEITVGATLLHVVDLHLETRINITDRILEVRPAVLDLPPQVIVAGDVNTNPFLWEDGSFPLLPTAQIVDTDQAPLLDDYMRGLGFETPAANVGPTETVHGIESRLDAIFTRGLAVTEAQVERSLDVSDHWPVWVDITLP
ncbi:MAG: endonuclease/exonuclease/phosphatase family [Deltaproteobacteria bacterium]|nr:endonuclease/exonuclease/phosphatase family [Deltaproteobacteria bacterium]